ncbi:MAG: VWA domain-containing protein [Chitinophagales bacterium]|nr:VWA domain-containing protein [Bacteroidota bacterium]MCB9042182.1 VWA domain-containing protein [Chitinophagales bacterium]
MFRFENSQWLYALLIPLFLLVLSYWHKKWQKNKSQQLSELTLLPTLLPLWSIGRIFQKNLLFVFALVLLIIALANPQFGKRSYSVQRQGVDVMIVLDVSNSMLAEDITPTNRLQAAKIVLSDLIDKLADDRLGIILFAGKAYLQMPLSLDHAAARMFLANAKPDLLPSQGTALAQALNLAISSFDDASATGKVILLLTDGEDHETGLNAALDEAAQNGIVIHTIGVGSEGGSPVPEFFGQQKIGYKKDASGEQVISKVNNSLLKKIASQTNGLFYSLNNNAAQVQKISEKIAQMDKQLMEERQYTNFESRFGYFLLPAILFLLWYLFLGNTKSEKQWRIFKEKQANP